MADGETPTDGSGSTGQSAPAAPATPAPARTEKATWRTLFAALPVHLAAGLSHLGHWLTHLGRGLTHLGRGLARLAEIKPTPLQRLALLSGLAVASIFGALAFPGNPIGQACVIAFVPGLCIAIGVSGTRWHARQGLDQHLLEATQNAVQTSVQLKRSVRYVDERLSAAQAHLESGSDDGALIEVVRAKTATELSLGVAEHASRQWGSTPPVDADGELICGSVAAVEDQYTLIINRGSTHGIKPDMVVAVLADVGEPLRDPETGEVIGELPTEKLRVKVIDVQPKYSRAVTYRTFTPATVGYPAMTGTARSGAASSDAGTFDFIDESISRMLEAELAEPIPAREKIANVQSSVRQDVPHRVAANVDIGDRVQQVK
ncbi:hypothetical protein [Mycobacterium camsae]|uniref:hypothetical protein n=1 Tax=Mycobacterium gordonae TaxID=1778 RepID=UPI001980E8DA|nr:hypothetical protein [Mycobacterium gordonae]